jgi:hypothetical protein
MPKERVLGAILPFPAPGPGGEPGVVEEQVIAEVRWSREAEHVSLVTRLDTHEVPGPGEDPIPVGYGMHCELDRRGINDLIRHLRRARDHAFGRDE